MVVVTLVFLGLLQFIALALGRVTPHAGMVIRTSKDIPIGFAHLEAKLYDVWTSGSANYGNHLSK